MTPSLGVLGRQHDDGRPFRRLIEALQTISSASPSCSMRSTTARSYLKAPRALPGLSNRLDDVDDPRTRLGTSGRDRCRSRVHPSITSERIELLPLFSHGRCGCPPPDFLIIGRAGLFVFFPVTANWLIEGKRPTKRVVSGPSGIRTAASAEAILRQCSPVR